MTGYRQLLALAGAVSLTACASTLPESQLIETRSTLQAAEEIGGENAPDAQLHIKYARDQIEIARDLADEGRDKAARQMLGRAQSDAELALALARTQNAREEAQRAWNDVQELQESF